MTNSQYPVVPLGRVLTQERESVGTPDGNGLPVLGVTNVTGVTITGNQTSEDRSQYLLLRPNHFVYNPYRINVGSLGLSGANQWGIVSPAYVVFRTSDDVDSTYIYRYLKSRQGHVQINYFGNRGSVRSALRFDDLCQIEIPLPPLDEQQRIVARIEELAARIEDARGLRREATGDCGRLLVAMAHRSDLDAESKRRIGWQEVTIGSVTKFVQDPHHVDSNANYPNFGIYSFGRGLFSKPPIDGVATSADVLYRVCKGQFIYSRLFAFEGAYGMVTDEFDGCFVSNEYPTFDCDPKRISADFLSAYFKSPQVWTAVAAGSKGLGDRRQRVQPSQVLAHRLWLPPLEWQQRIAAARKRIDGLKQLHAETATSLDALLPSLLDRAFRGEL